MIYVLKSFGKCGPKTSEEKAKVAVDFSMFCLLRDLLNSVLSKIVMSDGLWNFIYDLDS